MSALFLVFMGFLLPFRQKFVCQVPLSCSPSLCGLTGGSDLCTHSFSCQPGAGRTLTLHWIDEVNSVGSALMLCGRRIYFGVNSTAAAIQALLLSRCVTTLLVFKPLPTRLGLFSAGCQKAFWEEIT